MRTAFARIVPVSSDADARPEEGGQLFRNMTRKYLAVFHLLYMARDKERKREREREKRESHTDGF
jgi:hypothetical protein